MREAELQQYIWDNRTRWQELLMPPEIEEIDDDYASHFEGGTFELEGETETMEPGTFFREPDPGYLFASLIKRRIKDYYEHVKDLYFLGKEIRLEKDSDSTIRADFLAYSSGRTGFTIVELKVDPIKGREAFTELLAYGNHLQTLFPGLSADNIFFLLIAPLEVRIVRESVINMLLFQQRSVLALEPVYSNDGNIKFKPWVPTESELMQYSSDLFAEENFDVVKISWEEIPDYWNEEDAGSGQHYIDIMNRVSSYCAQIMESRQISGFVFASQAPSSFKKAGFTFLNSLVIVCVNPFRSKQGKTLVDFIPNLAKHLGENPELMYDLGGLAMTWSDHLMSIGADLVEFMTTNLSGKHCHIEITTLSWAQNFTMMEYGLNSNYRVFSTGILRQLYFEYLKLDYKYIQQYGHNGHFYWDHGDIPEYVVEQFSLHGSFIEFIGRLHAPFKDLLDFDE